MVSPICIHKMPFTHPQHTTMNKQLKNMMESMAPLPPSVEVFMGFVATAIANDLQGPQVDPLFGEIGHVDSGKPRGSAKNEIVGLRMAEEFTNACKAMDPPVSFTDVDDWMVSLAKYVLHVDVLFDTEEQRAQCLERRNVIALQTVKFVRSACCVSLFTRLNMEWTVTFVMRPSTLVALVFQQYARIGSY